MKEQTCEVMCHDTEYIQSQEEEQKEYDFYLTEEE